MIDSRFPDFLKNPEEYEKVEAFWLQKWEELLRRAGEIHQWNTQWFNTTFADGTPCRDGNPIFHAVDPERRLGVRAIQFEYSGNPREITYWINIFAKGEPEEIRELVISCSLTDLTLSVALDLMREWIANGEIQLSHESPYSPLPLTNPSEMVVHLEAA